MIERPFLFVLGTAFIFLSAPWLGFMLYKMDAPGPGSLIVMTIVFFSGIIATTFGFKLDPPADRMSDRQRAELHKIFNEFKRENGN